MFEDDYIAAFTCFPHSLNRPKSPDSIRLFVAFLFKGDNAVWFHQSLHYLDLDLEKFSHIPWLSVMYLTNRFTVSARV